MHLTNNDFSFQGYSVKEKKPKLNPMLLKKWEREAEDQAWIESTELDGEVNDFLEVYAQQVTIFHKVRNK